MDYEGAERDADAVVAHTPRHEQRRRQILAVAATLRQRLVGIQPRIRTGGRVWLSDLK